MVRYVNTGLKKPVCGPKCLVFDFSKPSSGLPVKLMLTHECVGLTVSYFGADLIILDGFNTLYLTEL